MTTTIRKESASDNKTSLILILKNGKDWKGHVAFTTDEIIYIKKQFADKNNTVVLNQLNRLLVAHNPEVKSEVYKTHEALRKVGNTLCMELNKHKMKSVSIVDESGVKGGALAMAEGMALGNYQFNELFSNGTAKKNSLTTIGVVAKDSSKEDVEFINITVQATYHARDLINLPLSHLNAVQLSKAFQKMGKEAGFKCTVLNKAKIQSFKMGGLLAVNKGSIDPPTFSVMEWKPRNAKNKKPYVLVGKGVVYDTGGLSLKPTANSMDFMKSDMGGAAVAGCAMYAIAKAKLPVHVIALVPATDNRPDGNAYVPGDVIKMYSGATVEVLNTDAEGRMILADALTWAKRYKPQLVMDFATLTGAAAAAVGQYGIVCMGTASEATKDKLKQSGNEVYERLAEFPFWDEYDELIKSDIADMKNIGGPYGGAITAGKFLQRFTDYDWMHFDIAGSAFLKAPDSYRGKNGTGTMVRMVANFFRHHA